MFSHVHQNKSSIPIQRTIRYITPSSSYKKVRTERGPGQRMILNLGTDFSVPEEKWKDLANRIEEIVTGQDPLFSCPEEIEESAAGYAKNIIAYHGKE